MGACRKVAQATEAVVTSVSRSTDDKSLKNDLQNAARDVSDSLNRLMDQIRYIFYMTAFSSPLCPYNVIK